MLLAAGALSRNNLSPAATTYEHMLWRDFNPNITQHFKFKAIPFILICYKLASWKFDWQIQTLSHWHRYLKPIITQYFNLEPISYTFTIVFRVIQRQKPGKRKPILSTDSKIRVPKSPWITGTAAGNRIFCIDISTYRDSRLQIHLHTIQMRCHPRRSSRCWSSTFRSFPPSMCTRRSWTRRSWTGSRLRINNNLGWR